MAKRRSYLTPALRETLWYFVLILIIIHTLLAAHLLDCKYTYQDTPEGDKWREFLEILIMCEAYDNPL